MRIRGGLEEEIHVALEEESLRRTGISIQRVIDRLAQENINVAGGTLKAKRRRASWRAAAPRSRSSI